jgi:hypothetical protein
MICLEMDVAGGIALSGFPQLGQKLADHIIGVLQEEQTIPGGVSILYILPCSFYCLISYRLRLIEEFKLLLNWLRRFSIANNLGNPQFPPTRQ